MRPIARHPANRHQGGFSLIELLVGVALGLVIVTSLAVLFADNSRAAGEIEKANRQIESGRYAMQLLNDDLYHAAFYGEFDASILAPAGVPVAALPADPCSVDLTKLKAALAYGVQGFDEGVGLTAACAAKLTGLKAGTDVLVIRRVATCAVGDADCDAVVAGTVYFQSSLCNSELKTPTTAYKLDTDTTSLTLHYRKTTPPPGDTSDACSGIAPVRRFLTHIYYIASNHVGTDGIPTLMRAELGPVGGALDFTFVPLVEGVENLQFEYGIGTPANPNIPIDYKSQRADAEWPKVVSIKVNLLARNTETSAGYTASQTYVLGQKPDPANPLTKTINNSYTFSDSYKRHVFQGLVTLPNVAARL